MRNSTVELFRLFFIYLIVVIHVFLHGSSLDYAQLFDLGKDTSTVFHFEMIMLGKLGVIGFIFISGYYGINSSWRKIVKYLLTVVFYIIILQLTFSSSVKGLVEALLHPYDKWWFIRYYLVLMVVAPLINSGWEMLSHKEKLLITCALLYIFFVGFFIGKKDSHSFMTFLVIYIVARFIRDMKHKENLIGLALIALVIYLLIPVILVNTTLDKYVMMWFSYNNILLLVIAAGMVIWADKHPSHNAFINVLSRSTLAVYLITDYYLMRKYDAIMLPYMFHWVGYLYCFFVCLACIMIDKIREFLFYLSKKYLALRTVNISTPVS